MGYVKEYPCTMPAEIGGTLWGISDFWGLIPYTVDKPFHCVAGSKEDGCYEERYFSTEDIGKSLFYTEEDYKKWKQKTIDILRSLSESDKTLGRLQEKIMPACEMWIEENSYTCMDELLNIADILGMPINLDFIEGIVNETK